MKPVSTFAVTVLFVLTSFIAIAQNKTGPSITPMFKNFPAELPCAEAQLANFFTLSKGQHASLNLSGQLVLNGFIMEKTKSGDLETVAIMVPQMENLVVAVIRKVVKGTILFYAAQINSHKSSDGYRLVKNNDGSYKFAREEVKL